MSDPTTLSVIALAEQLANRALDSRAVAEAFLARIAAQNQTSKAFIAVLGERALTRAAGAQERGPLHGVPYGAKDLFHAAGVATTGGSRAGLDTIAEEDAEVIATLEAAGGLLLGKTNLHEYAYGATGENAHFGTCPHPDDPSRLAGGSSSGSGAAVARRLVPFALGTDTGGSVRVPAALCGIVGFKPSHGRLSCEGVIPFAWSLDHVGLMTRGAADARFLFAVLSGAVQGQGDLVGLRLGVPRATFAGRCDPQVETAFEARLEALARAGCRLVDVALPDTSMARSASLAVQMAEAVAYHRPNLEVNGALYSQEFRAGLALGQVLRAEHYVNAQRQMAKYRRQAAALFTDVDLLVLPTCPITAPPIGQPFVEISGERAPTGNAVTRFTGFFNMTGQPAITLPMGRDAEGLPMGLQLVAARDQDAALLDAAVAVEPVVSC
ncbi:MAG: amidase [Pseudomonadota bacterium]